MLEVVERKRLKHGVLIAIEGIDGAGKTTQAKILLETLIKKGYDAVCFHEPTDGKWGRKIKELATNGRYKISPEVELQFFYLDRLEDVKRNIQPALQRKKIVIMDRYYLSSVAYQGARGLDLDLIEKKNETIAPIPNIAIIIDLNSEVALTRIRYKRNEIPNYFERKKYLEHVRQIFLKRFSNRTNVRIIDGDDTRPIQMIASDIWKIVEPIIKEAEDA
ncbi:MAG: dTMP kinase [Candidatus Bathyarchaeia archaeon]